MLPLNQDNSVNWWQVVSVGAAVIMTGLTAYKTFNPPHQGGQVENTYRIECHKYICTFETKSSFLPSLKSTK
jgi:hypothetical protein